MIKEHECKRSRQLGGVKNWSKLPTDSIKKLPTSFMDGPLGDFLNVRGFSNEDLV